MKDYLEPVFNLLTGAGFMVFLVAMLQVRGHLAGLSGACLKLALMTVPLGFFLMSWAGKENTLNKASPMLLAAGGVFFLTLALLASGLVLLVRERTGRDQA